MAQVKPRYVGIPRVEARPTGYVSRVAVGAALIAISLIAATAVLRSRATPVSVLVFGKDLEAGSTIADTDLAEVEVVADPDTLSHLVRAAEKGRVVGGKLLRSVRVGEPLLASSYSETGPSGRVVTLPIVRAGTSPGLAAGEQVDVLATFAPESEDARTVVVASGVSLVSISPAQEAGGADVSAGRAGPAAASGPVDSAGTALATVLASDEELVPLVFASQNALVALVRSVPGQNTLGRRTDADSPHEWWIPEGSE